MKVQTVVEGKAFGLFVRIIAEGTVVRGGGPGPNEVDVEDITYKYEARHAQHRTVQDFFIEQVSCQAERQLMDQAQGLV